MGVREAHAPGFTAPLLGGAGVHLVFGIVRVLWAHVDYVGLAWDWAW